LAEPSDATRVGAVLAGLATLGAHPDPQAISQGLDPAHARQALGMAVGAITEAGLLAELATEGTRPGTVALVIARGVFTMAIEWAALYLAAGCTVRLKAPTGDLASGALVSAFSGQGLPISLCGREGLTTADAVVAFGADQTIQQLRKEAEARRVRFVGFGHRFSLALIADPAVAQAVAWDVAWHDSRGCMAPVAVFVLGDPDPMVEALATAMAQVALAMPRGACDPGLGPEWRRRLGLARVLGTTREGADWAVAQLPSAHFVPLALPRMITVHPVSGAGELTELLRPWRAHLSSLGSDDLTRDFYDESWAELHGWFPRKVAPGTLQRPVFPRLHDGQPMLGCVLGAP
jgi:hypothetical protein